MTAFEIDQAARARRQAAQVAFATQYGTTDGAAFRRDYPASHVQAWLLTDRCDAAMVVDEVVRAAYAAAFLAAAGAPTAAPVSIVPIVEAVCALGWSDREAKRGEILRERGRIAPSEVERELARWDAGRAGAVA